MPAQPRPMPHPLLARGRSLPGGRGLPGSRSERRGGAAVSAASLRHNGEMKGGLCGHKKRVGRVGDIICVLHRKTISQRNFRGAGQNGGRFGLGKCAAVGSCFDATRGPMACLLSGTGWCLVIPIGGLAVGRARGRAVLAGPGLGRCQGNVQRLHGPRTLVCCLLAKGPRFRRMPCCAGFPVRP